MLNILGTTLTRALRALRWQGYRLRLGSLGQGSALGRWLQLDYPARIKIGDRVGISSRVTLRANTKNATGIDIGNDSSIQDGALLSANTGSIRVGAHSWIGPNSTITGNGDVTIGDHVLIAPHSIINTVSHVSDRCDQPISEQGLQCDPVVIENDVWVGARAVILQGVTIGHGSIIGAGAIVTRSIPPWSVAVGTPARVIKQRSNAPEAE